MQKGVYTAALVKTGCDVRNLPSSKKESLMLKLYVKTHDLLDRLSTDKAGTVSWEYVLVAALVVVAVGTAFGPGATGAVEVALKNGIGTVVTAFNGFL
jgi:hypothetical protein